MPIQYIEELRKFILTTNNTAYVFQLSEVDAPLHLYWGPKLPRTGDYPQPPVKSVRASFYSDTHVSLAELPLPTGIQHSEPCLRLKFQDGTRDIRLSYVKHSISSPDGAALVIHFKDTFYPLEVALHYQVFADCDIITRKISLTNPGQQPITLDAALSGSVPLPYDRGDFRLTQLAGAWFSEFRVERSPVTPGRKVLEGRQNFTGHNNNPFFALDLLDADGVGASETVGEVWYGGLQWTGNWKIIVEQVNNPYKQTRVAAGINDYDFSWQLGAGTSFETPWLALGYSGQGFGEMSRNLHRYQRSHLLPARAAQELRPVLYNSWEAVGFSVNEAEQLKLVEKAARIGAEVFVIDDGWFGQRHHDRAGLGDWYVNSEKFPNGLSPLINKVNELGLDFGIWVEPEMVNPDSDLYRTHPEWAYRFPNREPTTARNQLTLNLARPDVQAHLFGWLDQLLSKNNIRYLKWDYNRPISEPGWTDAPPEQQQETWVRHVQGLYQLVDRLRERHPQVLFEACSGGGGRADMGSLSHFDHLWTSDNTDPLDRLPIQQGYSLAYTPKTMYCWVTHMKRNNLDYSLKYRFHSSFMGSLGIGTNLNELTEAELTEAAGLVADYKAIRPLVQQGDFYRLTGLNQAGQALLAVQYLAPDRSDGVILAYNRTSHLFWTNPQRVFPRNLDPAGSYRLSGGLQGFPGEAPVSGEALMYQGVLPEFDSYLSSAVIRLKKV
jgi:alpha-galactosidase